MKAARVAARAGAWAIAGLVAGVVAALVLPLAFGARPYTVLSGSMVPAIAAGDMVVAERIEAREARIGDVVTFADPNTDGKLITHRVGGIRHVGNRIEFVTKGDANETVELWDTAAGGDLGRVAYKVPWVGHVAVLTRGRVGFALLVALPLLLLAVNELWRIWRRPAPANRPASPGGGGRARR